MGQASFPRDLKFWMERVEAELNELHRKLHPKRQPNLRDLQDVNGWGALTGYILAYDATTGRFKPMLAPPFLRFNLNGTLSVSSSDHDPVGGSGRLTLVRGRLKTAGSSTTTALLKADSTTVATLTFTSGNATPSYSPTTVDHAFDNDTYWWVDLTAAGTSAAGLVINGWGTAGAAPS